MQASTTEKYDITLYGATSFVGKIAAIYLLKQYGASNDSLSWCIAARSQQKLEELVAELGEEASDLPQLVADSMNPNDMQALCKSSKVIISTVGPYALYGEELVKACAESGTHYCDLTGEPLWIDEMIRKYKQRAEESGAMIVHCCGFDSIPSDLGVYFLQQTALERFGQSCDEVETGVKAIKGAASGGTVASLINAVKDAMKDPKLRKKAANPFLLCPEGHGYSTRQRTEPVYHSDRLKNWCAPFVMAAINSKVVHRSNALLENLYGDDFRYSEYMMMGKGNAGRFKAMGMTGGMGGFMAMVAIKPTRALMEKFVLPKPGEGPSPKEQEEGFYDLRIAGSGPNGETLIIKVTGDRDPGYGSTAKMLSESAACLLDLDSSGELKGGFWTPASLFREKLIDRLTQNAGLNFSVV